jgi:hypothetical protein
MKARFVALAIVCVVAVDTVEAQCPSGVASQGCKASVDLVNYLTPQLATAIAGGSSTLGQSGILGGLGHFAVSLRGTAVMNGAFPKIGDKGFSTNGQALSYATESQIIPGAGVDAAVGIWKGVNLGATNIGGIDALVSALYLPDVTGEGNDFSIKAKDGNLKLGFGVRIGVLDESAVTPGVHISYLQRDLPTVSLSGKSNVSASGTTTGGSFALNDFSVKTTAWRIVAAKNFLIFGLQAGLGQDTYKSSSNVSATIPTQVISGVTVPGQTASGAASMNMTRNNMFVGASVNFFVFKLVAEAGQVSGGSLASPFNTFDKPASDSRSYLSGGLRLAF